MLNNCGLYLAKNRIRSSPKQITLQNRQAQIDELYSQRKKLLLELDQHTTARASSTQKSVKRLNRKLVDQKVKLTLQPEGNRQPLVDFLNTLKLKVLDLNDLLGY